METVADQTDRLDATAIDALLNRQVALITVDDFCPPAVCAGFTEAVAARGLRKTFAGSTTPSREAGVSAIEYKGLREADYLDDVPAAVEERRRLLAGGPDPTHSAFESIGRAWSPGAKVAVANDRPYFVGNARLLKGSPVHNDWVPRDLPEWAIGAIRRQLSWHLYLSVPEAGGDFTVWDQPWDPADHRQAAGTAVTPTVLSGVASVSEPPGIGKLVLFDTRNYHAFDEVAGGTPSVVISSFLGVIEPNLPLVFWS